MNRKNKKPLYSMKIELTYMSMYLPALILFLLFVIIPLVQAVYFSLTDWDGISAAYNFIGGQNYITFFSDDFILRSISATLKYTITVTVLQNVVALALALALNQKFKGKNVLRSAFFIPSLLSGLVTGYIWSFLFSDPLMKLGKTLGLSVLGGNVLGNGTWAIFAAAFVSVWRSAGWTMMIYLAGLQGIPNELEEAAAIDGAGYWKRLRNIMLPLIAPSFTINFILTFERSLKDFDGIFALTSGGPGNSTMTMALNIYRESFFYSRGSYGTTIGVVMFAAMVILTLIQLKFFRKGEQNIE